MYLCIYVFCKAVLGKKSLLEFYFTEIEDSCSSVRLMIITTPVSLMMNTYFRGIYSYSSLTDESPSTFNHIFNNNIVLLSTQCLMKYQYHIPAGSRQISVPHKTLH